MAGMNIFSAGLPLGTMGPRGADFSPLFQILSARQQALQAERLNEARKAEIKQSALASLAQQRLAQQQLAMRQDEERARREEYASGLAQRESQFKQEQQRLAESAKMQAEAERARIETERDRERRLAEATRAEEAQRRIAQETRTAGSDASASYSAEAEDMFIREFNPDAPRPVGSVETVARMMLQKAKAEQDPTRRAAAVQAVLEWQQGKVRELAASEGLSSLVEERRSRTEARAEQSKLKAEAEARRGLESKNQPVVNELNKLYSERTMLRRTLMAAKVADPQSVPEVEAMLAALEAEIKDLEAKLK